MSATPISPTHGYAGGVDFEPYPAATASAADLLPEPQAMLLAPGDLGAEIAALAVSNGVVERWAARDARQADEARIESEDAAEVKAIHSEAFSMRVEACFDVGVTVAGAAAGGTTGGLIAKGGKAFIDGWLNADQKDDEAAAKGHEAASAGAKSAADDAHDNLAATDAFIKSALDFYQEYVNTRGQTAEMAARRA
jgi:hypothetical protein